MAFAPFVHVCPVRESLGLPAVILSIPQAWHKQRQLSAEIILTHERRLALAAALYEADEPTSAIVVDGMLYPVPVRHTSCVGPIPAPEIEAEIEAMHFLQL